MPPMSKRKDDYVCGNCRKLFRSVLELYEHGKTCRAFQPGRSAQPFTASHRSSHGTGLNAEKYPRIHSVFNEQQRKQRRSPRERNK
jgi:hypothetical protein